MTTYKLVSVKGTREITGTAADARKAAREWQAEIQSAFGVDVVDEAGETIYTAN